MKFITSDFQSRTFYGAGFFNVHFPQISQAVFGTFNKLSFLLLIFEKTATFYSCFYKYNHKCLLTIILQIIYTYLYRQTLYGLKGD